MVAYIKKINKYHIVVHI